MARLKGKYKGKTGKIDVIEDIIGTEELSGTYEGRELNWKRIEQERKLAADWQAKQLREARDRKEKELRKTMTDQVKILELNQKIDYLLPFLLDEDAYRYINVLRQLEPKICNVIMHYLFPPNDIEKIDTYVEVITKRGYGPKRKISLATIMKYERHIKKIKPKIEVEIDGERKSLQEAIGARKVA